MGASRLRKQVQKIFRLLNIRWVMDSRTLIGSYIAHDILPWDSQAYIAVRDDGYRLLLRKATFLSSHGLELKENVGHSEIHQLRYRYDKSTSKNQVYVTVVPFTTNSTSVLVKHSKGSQQTVVAFEDYFPLHMRPLGCLWLPSPRDPWKYFSHLYGNRHSHFFSIANIP